MRADVLREKIKCGGLRRKDNGEPIDWIDIYENWDMPDERLVDL